MPAGITAADTAAGDDMRGILFLCVANSARSQMAEGIARSLVPPGIGVWSAGSNPRMVRPEAIAVLREIGIHISGYRSKGIPEIPAAKIDTVITLCAEEVCPLFFGKAERLHWPLPDPAAVEGPEETRLAAFREIRDELRRRIEGLVAARARADAVTGTAPNAGMKENDPRRDARR
jgi:protein-tyrosine-phosphatase